MSRAPARVPGRWWSDPEFLRLSNDAKLLLVMLWTMPETPLAGIGALSVPHLADKLGLSLGKARSRLAELEQAGFVRLDADAPQIWLTGYVETQLGAMPTTSTAWHMNTVSSINSLVQTALVAAYRKHYGLAEKRPGKGAKKRGSTGVSGGGSPRESAGPSGRGVALPFYARGVPVDPEPELTLRSGVGHA